MAVHSGKNGTLTIAGQEETPVTNWKLTTSSANDAYAANDTSGWKKRVSGVKDSSGSFEMKDSPSVDEGDSIALVLYTGEDIFTLDAIVESIDVETDMNDGTIVGFIVNFAGDGAVTKSTGSYV